MRTFVMFAMTLGLAGCEPTYLETSAEVDMFLSQARYSAVCVAFKNENEARLREYTAQQLARFPDEPVATQCVCDAITSFRHASYDESVMSGLAGSKRDDFVACALRALEKARGEERERLVVQIAEIAAPASYVKLVSLLQDEREPPEVRAAAGRGLMAVRADHTDLLIARLTADPDAGVRATIAKTLENADDAKVVAALVHAAQHDPDGEVRAAALRGVVKLRIPETDAMVCKAMIDDPDERVRDRAVRSFKGSKRPEALACLERRLKTFEESPVVRDSTMAAIYASPHPRAPKILCDNVGPFLKMYVKDLPVTRMEGADIMKYQNNRDYENSLTCAQTALRQGGLPCYGQYYLAVWINELGGKAHKPTCKGMEPPVIILED